MMPFLAKHDEDREGASGHEDVGEQVEGDSSGSVPGQLSGGFIPCKQAEQNVTHVGDGRVGEETLDVGLGEGGEIAPGK